MQCNQCFGSGEIYGSTGNQCKKKCPNCNGTGKIKGINLTFREYHFVEPEKFPAIWISEEKDILLFATKHTNDHLTGVIIHGNRLGDYSESWNAFTFKPFHGEISIVQK